MYEEDSSVASSYGDGDEMDHFINRCSICFESQLDMCLNSCRDQFCIDCFQRYISEVVKSSWGLNVTPITCPVCNDLIPKHEWTRYVPQHIVEIYEKFNKPYRSYIRSCPHCDNDMIPCSHQETLTSSYTQTKIFCNLIKEMLQQCSQSDCHKNHTEHIAVKRWISIYKREDWTVADLPSSYKKIMKDVTTFEKNHIKSTNKEYGKQVSLQFMTLCVKPEIWKEVQFAHINFFPDIKCSSCKISFCLHCGYDSHCDIDCKDNMLIMSRTMLDKEMRKTVKWKLQNSRQCPKCSIMINRDEGCNKVDCSYCGFTFCWACQSSWSEGCGFYRCSVLPNNSNTSSNNSKDYSNGAMGSTEEKTELGVPNIKNIQARINRSSNNHSNMLDATQQQQQQYLINNLHARHLFLDEN